MAPHPVSLSLVKMAAREALHKGLITQDQYDEILRAVEEAETARREHTEDLVRIADAALLKN